LPILHNGAEIQSPVSALPKGKPKISVVYYKICNWSISTMRATSRGQRSTGKEWEIGLLNLLREAGFQVEVNAGAARPRQTDLYARIDGLDLLIEAKNRRRRADVSDIDDLRSRLRHVTADVVGALFTTSGVTQGAIAAIEADRTREVLVFVREEVDWLREAPSRLHSLLSRKREELRVHGRAWFGPKPDRRRFKAGLPPAGVEFRVGQIAATCIESKTRGAHAAYVLNVPDAGQGSTGGALLSVRLTLSEVDDVRAVLGYLHESFGLSERGMFSIHQSDCCWHGVGAQSFLRELEHWAERYEASEAKWLHHSEDVKYFDHLRDGWVLLSLRQRVNVPTKDDERASYLHQSELSIQLGGVPIDMTPFVALSRYTGNEWAQFGFVVDKSVRIRRLKKKIALDVIGEIVEVGRHKSLDRKERPMVSGVIAKNPFFRRRQLPAELKDEDDTLNDLLSFEILLCDVRDWHDQGDLIDRYMLEGFETLQSNYFQAIRPFGTWNRIVRRVDGKPPSPELLAIELESVIDQLEAKSRPLKSVNGSPRNRRSGRI
jgi:hypothetical protein